MSDHDLEPLPPDLAALLDAERAPIAPPAGAAERVLERAERTLGWIPAGPSGGGSSGSGAPPAGRSSSLPRPPWTTLGALAIGAAGGAGVVLGLRPAPAPQIIPVPVLIVATANASAIPETPPPSASPAPPPAASAEPPHRAPRPVASATASSDAELAAERALLEVARTAVGRGNGAAALVALERHATEFPRGRLAEEREALWIQALVLVGRKADARARADGFRARFPSSFLRSAVEEMLGGDSMTDGGAAEQSPR